MTEEIDKTPQPGPETAGPDAAPKANKLARASELTEEQKTSYVVDVYNPTTDSREEVLVPRNYIVLKGSLETSVRNHGDVFLHSQITVSAWKPIAALMPGAAGSEADLMALVRLAKGPVQGVIADLEKMIEPPGTVVSRLMGSHDVFESSECLFASLTFFFPSAGATGTVLVSPIDTPTEEQGRMMFNAMISQAEMFRDNLKRGGIDIDRKQIILPGGRIA